MSVSELQRLRELVDLLWGELPVDVVMTLDEEIVDACRANHELVAHGPAVEPVPVNCFRIIVETTWGPTLPQTIEAANLSELFEKAAQLPFQAWFPPEEEPT